MSAFMVCPAHITAMLAPVLDDLYDPRMTWYHQGERYVLDRATADEVGRMLAAENMASVRYRYQDADEAGMFAHWPADLTEWRYDRTLLARTPTPIELIKAVHCYRYQSCEHPGWESSCAHSLCLELVDWAAHALPGYEEAPWEWRGWAS